MPLSGAGLGPAVGSAWTKQPLSISPTWPGVPGKAWCPWEVEVGWKVLPKDSKPPWDFTITTIFPGTGGV